MVFVPIRPGEPHPSDRPPVGDEKPEEKTILEAAGAANIEELTQAVADPAVIGQDDGAALQTGSRRIPDASEHDTAGGGGQ